MSTPVKLNDVYRENGKKKYYKITHISIMLFGNFYTCDSWEYTGRNWVKNNDVQIPAIVIEQNCKMIYHEMDDSMSYLIGDNKTGDVEYLSIHNVYNGSTHTLLFPLSRMRDTNCYHDWKKYIGFTDIYYYCMKCDDKRKDLKLWD